VTIQEQRSVTTEAPTATESGGVTNRTVTSHRLAVRPTTEETARRILVLVFGLIELVIGARVVLLLMDARTTNGLVSGIINLSNLFVAPFEGILRTNSVNSSGSVLDVAAVLALAGWAIVEVIVFWIIGIFRREPALA